jgi:hypothetical protein
VVVKLYQVLEENLQRKDRLKQREKDLT